MIKINSLLNLRIRNMKYLWFVILFISCHFDLSAQFENSSTDTINVYFKKSHKYIISLPCISLSNCNERIESLYKSNDTLFLTYKVDTIRDKDNIRGAEWAIDSYIVKENEKIAIRIPMDLEIDSVNALIIKYMDNAYFLTRKKDTFILSPKLSTMGKRKMLRIYYRTAIIKTFKFFGC